MLARLVVFAVCLSLATANANAGVIAYWNFNDENLTVDRGSGTLTHDFISGTVTWVNDGTFENALSGVDDGYALSVRAGADTANNNKYMQFAIDTTNYTDITLSYAVNRSATGFTDHAASYSTDGSSFTDSGLSYQVTTSYAVAAFDFSSVSGLDNNPNAVLRITGGGASKGHGNNHFGNVRSEGTAVPERSTLRLLGFLIVAYGGSVFCRIRKRQRLGAQMRR